MSTLGPSVWILVLMAWISLAVAEHGPPPNPCGYLLQHRTAEVAVLNAMDPEVREDAAPEDIAALEAQWLAWRAVKQQALAELQQQCGVTPP